MAQSDSTSFTYETARHKRLMAEYASLSSPAQFAEWGKRAPAVAAYMNDALARVARGIQLEKERASQERDKRQRQGMEMATMQLENFHGIVKKQLDELLRKMEKLPTGSVRAEYDALIKPWSPKADTPYLRILVGSSGEVTMDGMPTSLDLLNGALDKLSDAGGLVLYSRETAAGQAPPAAAERVIKLVIDHRLPIRLCERADFSDAIDEGGRLRVSA